MGYGDFKLFAVFGAWLGWQHLPLLILMASLMGACVGVYLRLKHKDASNQAFPFGPYIALSGWINLFYGAELLNWYLSSWI